MNHPSAAARPSPGACCQDLLDTIFLYFPFAKVIYDAGAPLTEAEKSQFFQRLCGDVHNGRHTEPADELAAIRDAAGKRERGHLEKPGVLGLVCCLLLLNTDFLSELADGALLESSR